MRADASCHRQRRQRWATRRVGSPRAASLSTGQFVEVVRRLKVMGCFSKDQPTVGVLEIVARTGLNESVISDDADYLVRLGYLRRGDGGQYKIAEAHVNDWV